MRKARFKETQIVRVLKEVEGGRQVNEVCREHGISDATYYNWKTKYGGMEIADIRKLKELADENRRLKQMYADLSLKHQALKEIVQKKRSGLFCNRPESLWRPSVFGFLLVGISELD